MSDLLHLKRPILTKLFTRSRMSATDVGTRPPITALLIDVSGTLHVGEKPTPDAVNSIRRLRESAIDFRLCSNTSNQSTGSLIQQLEKLGFDLQSRQESLDDRKYGVKEQCLVWTSIGVISKVIRNMDIHRPYLLLSESARDEVVRDINIDNDAHEPGSYQPEGYDAVVVGLAPSLFDYHHLNTAFRILKGEHRNNVYSAAGVHDGHKGIPLIAANKSRYIQKEEGLALGPGPFVAALEHASGVTAHVVGKPTKEFFQMVIDDFRGKPRGKTFAKEGKVKGRIAVIGDDVEADLGGGALELGLWRVLVKTGKYRAGDEKRPGLQPPDEVCESFSGFIDSILREQEEK